MFLAYILIWKHHGKLAVDNRSVEVNFYHDWRLHLLIIELRGISHFHMETKKHDPFNQVWQLCNDVMPEGLQIDYWLFGKCDT